ncbi:AbrB family transcriptional regulator [Nitratireductor mangrovi]|uniref:AbrB family transcriptional regulator n=1 Tax=Nitratireductor mangrovi TaxID=2599600 RepID=A0A5B8KY98_9HYPH|nr:AbrB family transcriptional regulator [Nitratireductor mangrovi]QDZ00694.1 AbrB family transcriptional regulator [Nitratireductor mangrovi]
MQKQIEPEPPISAWQPALQWAALLVLSVCLAGVLELAGLPAALLIGPMIAAVVCGTNGATVRVPPTAYLAAQGVVGCLVATALAPEMLAAFVARWPLFLGVVLATLAASGLLGAMVSRWGALPGTTAVWGSAPGAASAMVVMADAFGADARLVAFMQYLRVIFVSLSAALLARFFVDTTGAPVPAIEWFPPLAWPDFPATLAIALVGAFGGKALRLPGGALLTPILLGAALQLSGLVALQLPEWLLALSYTIVGWTIGLKFTRPILVHAARALPQVVLAILLLIAFCAAIGAVMAPVLGVDPLTAFLATSPGGMDSIAIIAAASRDVDLSFVMTLQMARFVIVLLFGPPLARLIAGRIKP